jgi:hypothetical protein
MNKLSGQLFIFFLAFTLSRAEGNWRKLNSSTNDNLVSVTTNYNGTIVALGDGGTVVRSIDSGNTWSVVTRLSGFQFTKVLFSPTGRCFVVGAWSSGVGHSLYSRTYYSTDAGANWQVNKGGPSVDGYPKDIDFIDAATGFFLFKHRTANVALIFGTADSGKTWRPIEKAIDRTSSTARLSVNRSGTKLIVNGTNHIFWWDKNDVIDIYDVGSAISPKTSILSMLSLQWQWEIAVRSFVLKMKASPKNPKPDHAQFAKSLHSATYDFSCRGARNNSVFKTVDSWRQEDFQSNLNLNDITIDRSGLAITVAILTRICRQLRSTPTSIQSPGLSTSMTEPVCCFQIILTLIHQQQSYLLFGRVLLYP